MAVGIHTEDDLVYVCSLCPIGSKIFLDSEGIGCLQGIFPDLHASVTADNHCQYSCGPRPRASHSTCRSLMNTVTLAQTCILAGCDFVKGLPGIGMRKAHTHMKRLRSFLKVPPPPLIMSMQEGAPEPQCRTRIYWVRFVYPEGTITRPRVNTQLQNDMIH